MVVTFCDNDEINILKNKDYRDKVKEIKSKYNINEDTILDILKEFSIGLSSNPDMQQISNLLDKGYSLLSITNKLKSTEAHIKTIIKKSPQLQLHLNLNISEFNFRKKYGVKLFEEVKKIPDIDFNSLIDIPLSIFKSKSVEELVELGISDYKIEEAFLVLGKMYEFNEYKKRRKIQKAKEKFPNPIHIQMLYENGNETFTIRYLSNEFNIPYVDLCKIKRLYQWKKKCPNSKTKLYSPHNNLPIALGNDVDGIQTDVRQKLHRITKLYLEGNGTIYGLSKRYKMSIPSVVSIIKSNFELHEIDLSELRKNTLREIPELFIDAHITINNLASIFGMSEFDIKKVLEKFIGTFPQDINEYREDLFSYNWSEFQLAFLDSDLTNTELSKFLNIPVSIIYAKRKDLEEGKLPFFIKNKKWLNIYNKLTKSE